ncbi:hypothetical protein CAEBREN_31294, partial [Caenorhabditis brenneri]
DSSTAVLTNGDRSVLGQSNTGLINMTLTCNSNSQWVITAITASTSGTSSVLGTVVDDLKCGEIPAATTTTPTTTTPTTTTTTIPTTTTSSGACQLCPNMQAIALTSSQLVVNGATNGQLLLSHSVDQSSKCRIVVIKCRGENTNQNATIFFNANGQSLSAMYGQVATSMACSPSNTWQRNGVEIDGVACMITSVVGATSTSPAPITTVAPTPTTQSSNGPSASCNSAFATAVSTPGYTSGFMTVDTKTSGSVMTASITCASPVTTQTAVLLDSNNNQVSYGVGSTFMTLTCNSNSQWVTPTGTVITTLGCATVAPATTTTTIATTVPTPAATTTTTLAAGDCSAAAWNAWQEWSSCTDTCGSCGTQQRFRSCNKPLDTCTCTGSAYEKNYCNLAVCKFPRASCCDGFTPHSSGGTFIQHIGCPCGAGFMCMRGGCVARAAAAGTKTFRDESVKHADLKQSNTPDEHFSTCCTLLDVPTTCTDLCSYSTFSAEEVNAVLLQQSTCPMTAIRKIHFCAARGTNHTECCSKSLVPTQCHSFCDQSHDRGDNDLSIAHLQCVHFFNDIKSCFMEHANSEYFEGFNEDTQHENEETSLASSF